MNARIIAAAGTALAFLAGCSSSEPTVACPDEDVVFEAESVSANVVFLLDRSGSMHLPISATETRWTATKAALFAMFDQLEYRVEGDVTFFPDGDAPLTCCPVTDPNCGNCGPADVPGPAERCSALTYDDAEVSLLTPERIDLLKKQVTQSDDDNYWGTPMAPALDGAMRAASHQAQAWQTAVVLLTDGKPTACDVDGDASPNDIEHAVAAVADGAEKGILTYVVGVVDGEPAADTRHLSALATAGGTARYEGCAETDDCAYSVHIDSFAKDVNAALQSIAHDTTSCTFMVDQRAFIDGEPYVAVTTDGERLYLPRDPEHQEGWDYVPSGELTLYGESCELFKAQPHARVQVVLGCDAQMQ